MLPVVQFWSFSKSNLLVIPHLGVKWCLSHLKTCLLRCDAHLQDSFLPVEHTEILFPCEFLCHVACCISKKNDKTPMTLKQLYLQHPPPELMCFFSLVTDFIFLIYILKLSSLGQISVFLFLQVFLHVIYHK